MSELKVNTISGIAGSVKVNDPVGIGAVAKSGYDLNVDGKVNLEGSVEVITVPASNFGVRIRAPLTATTSPGFGDSTLQFTNNQGTTEWASLHAKSDASLEIRTDNDPALTINNAQVINHLGASLFTNTATFNNAMQVNGQAIFAASVIPQCGGVPTTTTHLTNKAYVDNAVKTAKRFYFTSQIQIPVNAWVSLKNIAGVPYGAYSVRITVTMHTGQGPDIVYAETKGGSSGKITSTKRAIGWAASLGDKGDAGSQMTGEIPCIGYYEGFTPEDTLIFISGPVYNGRVFVEGYWN
jgi:hypothetical protein